MTRWIYKNNFPLQKIGKDVVFRIIPRFKEITFILTHRWFFNGNKILIKECYFLFEKKIVLILF